MMAVPQIEPLSQALVPMDSSHHADLLAKWRKTEQALEAGLDPELAKRLDDLRAEDARLMQQMPIRSIDPTTGPLLRRAG